MTEGVMPGILTGRGDARILTGRVILVYTNRTLRKGDATGYAEREGQCQGTDRNELQYFIRED